VEVGREGQVQEVGTQWSSGRLDEEQRTKALLGLVLIEHTILKFFTTRSRRSG
jgi:hypothetical protein